MSTLSAFKEQLANAADDVRAPQWLTRLARVGYAARGVVFLLIGGLAVLAALGRGGQTGDSKDALQATMDTPGGAVWLSLLAAGLLAFALWRGFQALVDPDHGESILSISQLQVKLLANNFLLCVVLAYAGSK